MTRQRNRRAGSGGKVRRPAAKYSKVIVALVIGLNAAFAAAALFVFYKVGSEPTALIAAWFSFTTGELWMLSGIKKREQTPEQNIQTKEGMEDEY